MIYTRATVYYRLDPICGYLVSCSLASSPSPLASVSLAAVCRARSPCPPFPSAPSRFFRSLRFNNAPIFPFFACLRTRAPSVTRSCILTRSGYRALLYSIPVDRCVALRDTGKRISLQTLVHNSIRTRARKRQPFFPLIRPSKAEGV